MLHIIKNFYFRYERHISSAALIGGFVFDAVTLKRVDLFLENFWVVVHLLMAAASIALLNLYESGRFTSKVEGRAHFWLTIAIQFAFGGLLSTFIVFYFRSAELASSWPFFLLLGAVFAGNELLKKHYTRIVFQISVFFIALFSYLIFLLPIIIHKLNDFVFLASGILSLGFIALFLVPIYYTSKREFKRSRKMLFAMLGCIYLLITFFYFTGIIPPLPLSLKDAGVYHSLRSNGDGSFTVEGESGSWLNFLRPQVFHEAVGGPVYFESAVFAPAKLETDMYHNWQYFDESKNRWVEAARIRVPIIGGREDGYRFYSFKQNISPGLWRVDVETARGQVVGRVRFEVVEATTTPTLITETK